MGTHMLVGTLSSNCSIHVLRTTALDIEVIFWIAALETRVQGWSFLSKRN